MLYHSWAVTQEQAALSDGALLTDAAAGYALMRQLDAAAEAVRIETDGLFDAGWPLSDDEVDELMADAPEGWDWSGEWTKDAVAAEYRDDYVGL